jgi:GDP/UDP-N,N'-diacetylbacillosamine 2-epimerase (hydrolysing)
MRKIAIVTGTRAEYGLLYCIIKHIHEDPQLELQLIVTGMHLMPEFGSTLREIEKDGVPIAKKVDIKLSGDSEEDIATSMGRGLMGFAKAYSQLKPDILVVLGDRFEIFSAVAAAVPFRIPIAHIHGGESTEGAMDELIRHAITKMSHIHFTSTATYRKRVVQMGERPANVFYVGAPGLDYISKDELITKTELFRSLAIPGGIKAGIVTYHPVTLEDDSVKYQIRELLKALSHFKDIYWIITLPNADTGRRTIVKEIKDFVHERPKIAKCVVSLGQSRYLSLMKHADLMVGNSSSGLIEAPSFKLPVVNIGDRQTGRVRVGNVIDVPDCKASAIQKAIQKAVSPLFKRSLAKLKNPYWRNGASAAIVSKLKTICLDTRLIKKAFYDL